MAHKKNYVVKAFGDVNLGIETNSEEVQNLIENCPICFSTAGNFKLDKFVEDFEKDLEAIIKIIENNEDKLNVSRISRTGPIKITLKGRIDKYQKTALKKRVEGDDVKTIGSLIARTARVCSVKNGNIFLHGTGIVDSKAKILYVILGTSDREGKSALTNGVLQYYKNNNHEAKILSTALRIKVLANGKCYAYPQNYGANEHKIYTIIPQSEEYEILEKIGFKEVKDEILEDVLHPSRKLFEITGYEDRVDLSEYYTIFIFPRPIPQRQPEDKIYPLLKDEVKQRLYNSWLSVCSFGMHKLFGKIDTQKFTEWVNKQTSDVKDYLSIITNKINASLDYVSQDANNVIPKIMEYLTIQEIENNDLLSILKEHYPKFIREAVPSSPQKKLYDNFDT